jgi:hypothetical protein
VFRANEHVTSQVHWRENATLLPLILTRAGFLYRYSLELQVKCRFSVLLWRLIIVLIENPEVLNCEKMHVPLFSINSLELFTADVDGVS